VVFSYLSDVFEGVCKFSRPQAVVFLRQWFNLYLVKTVCCPSIDLIFLFFIVDFILLTSYPRRPASSGFTAPHFSSLFKLLLLSYCDASPLPCVKLMFMVCNIFEGLH